MGMVLLIFVICLMVGFVLLAFLQKSQESEDDLPILSLEKVKQFKENQSEDE